MPELLYSAVRKIRIHPAIGITRLGNHPEAYFIGPEIPGVVNKPVNGYKMAGMVKRQGVRFRLYAYDKNDELLGEITEQDASISWSVELANKKAEWKQFDGLFESDYRRNEHVKQSAQRKRLVIGPEKHSLTGSDKAVMFDNSSFTAFQLPGECGGRCQRALNARTVDNITLGEMITDKAGRLIVLGGYGQSGAPFGDSADHYANNDGWYDDIADGPVDARVRFHGSKETVRAEGAWVISAPPDFAPEIGNIVSMYDVLYDKAVQSGQLTRPQQPSFSHDIYPLLKRALDIRWVFDIGTQHQSLETVLQLGAPASLRQLVFNSLRNPDGSGGGIMPKLYTEVDAIYAAGLSVTPTQYEMLKQWRDGEFVVDTPKENPEITPEGLDRAALDACVGGGFFPGIEMGWFLRDKLKFSEFLRIDRQQPTVLPDKRLQAGDITKQMALPWQADFAKCAKEPEGESSYYGWWPTVRPDDVLPENGFRPEPWARGVSLDGDHKAMAEKWFRLGFVVRVGDEYRETERSGELL
ncbi:MAG: LodA/GoxA family CTQ-dependent oxidase [Thiolinea sp.]